MIKHIKENEKTYVDLPGGVKQTMPRYYKEKIYSENERRKIQKDSIVYNESCDDAYQSELHRKAWIQRQFEKVKEDRQQKRRLL